MFGLCRQARGDARVARMTSKHGKECQGMQGVLTTRPIGYRATYCIGMVSYSRVYKYGFVLQQYAVYAGIPGFDAAYQSIPRYSEGYVAL